MDDPLTFNSIFVAFSVLLDVTEILTVLTESVDSVRAMDKAMKTLKEKDIIGKTLSKDGNYWNEVKLIDANVGGEEKEKKVGRNSEEMDIVDEVSPILSSKQLSSLTNSISTVYTNNTDSILSREILSRLSEYNNAITVWADKTQLLLPQKSTRSKTSKEVKTTTVRDLQEVNIINENVM